MIPESFVLIILIKYLLLFLFKYLLLINIFQDSQFADPLNTHDVVKTADQ